MMNLRTQEITYPRSYVPKLGCMSRNIGQASFSARACAVLLSLKFNQLFLGYFDPKKMFSDNENKWFSGWGNRCVGWYKNHCTCVVVGAWEADVIAALHACSPRNDGRARTWCCCAVSGGSYRGTGQPLLLEGPTPQLLGEHRPREPWGTQHPDPHHERIGHVRLRVPREQLPVRSVANERDKTYKR